MSGILVQNKRTNLQKETLQRNSRDELNFNELFESSPDMLFIIKPDGEVIWVNKTGAKTLGYSRSELIGQSVWKVVHPDNLSEVKSRISYIIKKKKIHAELQFHKIKKDGSKLYVNERTQLEFNNNGEVN